LFSKRQLRAETAHIISCKTREHGKKVRLFKTTVSVKWIFFYNFALGYGDGVVALWPNQLWWQWLVISRRYRC